MVHLKQKYGKILFKKGRIMTITHVIEKVCQVDGIDYDIVITLPTFMGSNRALLSSKEERVKDIVKRSLDFLKNETSQFSPSGVHFIIPLNEESEAEIEIESSVRLDQIAKKRVQELFLTPLKGLFRLGTLLVS